MVLWLRALLLIGLFAGLGVRASGAHFDREVPVDHQAASCEAGAKAISHDSSCPPYHHEHEHPQGECCHAPVWFAMQQDASVVFPLEIAGERSRCGNERAPDGPVLSLDKPPLI